MNKKDIQKRISQKGKPLALSKFSWDEKTKTFCSTEKNLLINFGDLEGSVIKSGNSSTIKSGYHSTIKSGDYSTIGAGNSSTIKAGYHSTIGAGNSSTIKAGYHSTIGAGNSSTIKAGYHSTIGAGNSSTIDVNYLSTIHVNGKKVVIVNRNVLEVILPDEGDVIQICPYNVDGYIKNGLLDGEPHILADGILSKVIKKRGDVYHVINHGETEETYIVEKGKIYSHGKTLKEARESLLYKISDRDKSQYENLTLDSILTLEECISMYRIITGACEAGTRYFIESLDKVKNKYSVKEIIDLTQVQYGNKILQEFINRRDV